MWIRDNEPEVYRRTHKTLCAKDYINFRLTGRMATDYCDASGTNAFDLNTFRWSETDHRTGRDWTARCSRKPWPSTDILGTVTGQAARGDRPEGRHAGRRRRRRRELRRRGRRLHQARHGLQLSRLVESGSR